MIESSEPPIKHLEQKLLAMYESSVELVREISIEMLLDKIANITLEQVNASYAAVSILNADGEVEKFVSVGLDWDKQGTQAGKNVIGEVLRSSETIRVNNINNDPRYIGLPELTPPMRSFLGVPIRHGEYQLGQILLANKDEGEKFTMEDQLIIEMIASFSAVAISNAKLYKDLILRDRALTRRNENLALLDQLASTLATSTDIDQVLDRGLTQLMDYFRLEVGEIFLRIEDSKNLQLLIHRGESVENLWKRPLFIIGESTVGRTASSGNPVVLDLLEYEYADLNPEAKTQGIHQLAVLPMTGRRGVVGVLCVATCHPQPLDDTEVQFVQAISSWMATAIENIRLNESGKRLAVLEERDRFGMDLHDGIIQSIYGVGLTLEHARLLMKEDPGQSANRIEQAIKDLNHTIRDIRAYILDLRPHQLKNENLMQGIHRLVQEFRANTLIEVNLQGPEDELASLPEVQAVALFHICQEALANIAKHAKARHVNITVWTTVDRALLEVSDDGRGFDLEKVKLTIGHGLSNIQTRAANACGDVEINSDPGKGTSVMAWVPLPENEPLVFE